MPAVLCGTRQISYWIGKAGLSKEGEALLFIHGAGGGQYVWGAQKSFFERRYDTILVDLPGHGESEGEGEDEIAGYARHVHSFLGSIGLKRVVLVGHSMGGAIAQWMALDFPEAIKGIILAGTGARLKVLPAILDGIRNHFDETVRSITRYAYSRKTPPEFIERGISELLKCRPEILHGDFLACDRFDITSRVESISVPTLILCGEEDELTPVKYSKYLYEKIKGARLEVIPDAGHMVMLESPGLFNKKIHQFISDFRLHLPAAGRDFRLNDD